jgi:hypothetical protein
MKLTKDNIDEYIKTFSDGSKYLHLLNEKFTSIEYLTEDLYGIYIQNSIVEYINCELPKELKHLQCQNSNLRNLPLIPKSLCSIDTTKTNLPEDLRTYIWDHGPKCFSFREKQLNKVVMGTKGTELFSIDNCGRVTGDYEIGTNDTLIGYINILSDGSNTKHIHFNPTKEDDEDIDFGIRKKSKNKNKINLTIKSFKF